MRELISTALVFLDINFDKSLGLILNSFSSCKGMNFGLILGNFIMDLYETKHGSTVITSSPGFVMQARA